MDFSSHDSPELARFRSEAGAWLDAHAPADVRMPLERASASPLVAAWAPAFQRDLYDAGLAAPSWPRPYGRGLSAAHDRALQEEIDTRGIPDLYAGARLVAAAVLRCGSEEQRRSFVAPSLRGDACVWRSLADAGAVVDPESAPLQAVRDGDVYLVSGEAVFTGGPGAPDYFWTLAVTDPQAPPAARLSAFLIPAAAEGIVVQPTETVAAGRRAAVTFTSVPVPLDHRIGPEGAGAGVNEQADTPDAAADRLLAQQRALLSRLAEHVRGQKDRLPRSRYHKVRGLVAEAYINSRLLGALSARNRWLREAGEAHGYEQAQYALRARALHAALADKLYDALGPAALLLDPEWAPLDGDAALLQSVEVSDASFWESPAGRQQQLAAVLGLPGTQGPPPVSTPPQEG